MSLILKLLDEMLCHFDRILSNVKSYVIGAISPKAKYLSAHVIDSYIHSAIY